MGGLICKGWNLLLVLMAMILLIGVDADTIRRFRVGGADGWVPDPKQAYNSWAESQRFKMDDTLWFKYQAGQDSVLWVTDTDYYGCNISRPVRNYTDGDTVFPLFHSGPFYFISGVPGHCGRGQRLVVVVLSDRSPAPTSPSPATPPTRSPSHPPVVPHPPSQPPKGPHPPSQPPSGPHPAPSQPPSATPTSEPAPPPGKITSPPSAPSTPGEAPAPSPAKSASSPSRKRNLMAGSFLAAMICWLVVFV